MTLGSFGSSRGTPENLPLDMAELNSAISVGLRSLLRGVLTTAESGDSFLGVAALLWMMSCPPFANGLESYS